MYSLFWFFTQCVGLAFSIFMPLSFLSVFYDNMALKGEVRINIKKVNYCLCRVYVINSVFYKIIFGLTNRR